jgi:hypothetical protein
MASTTTSKTAAKPIEIRDNQILAMPDDELTALRDRLKAEWFRRHPKPTRTPMDHMLYDGNGPSEVRVGDTVTVRSGDGRGWVAEDSGHGKDFISCDRVCKKQRDYTFTIVSPGRHTYGGNHYGKFRGSFVAKKC